MDCEFSTSVEASRSREVACTQGCIKWPNRTGSRCQEPTHGESGKLDDTESGGLEGTKGVSNEGYGEGCVQERKGMAMKLKAASQ